jgi:hypothetical protein
MPDRIAGTLELTHNGTILKIASEGIDYHLGKPKREPLSGPDDPFQGYREEPQPPWVSGTGRVVRGFSVGNFTDLTDETIAVILANGTELGFFEAMFTGEGTANSGQAEVQFKFTAKRATEIVAS